MKKCPYCAEEIQDEAIFCRYCKHDLVESSIPKSKKESISSVIFGLNTRPPANLVEIIEAWQKLCAELDCDGVLAAKYPQLASAYLLGGAKSMKDTGDLLQFRDFHGARKMLMLGLRSTSEGIRLTQKYYPYVGIEERARDIQLVDWYMAYTISIDYMLSLLPK